MTVKTEDEVADPDNVEVDVDKKGDGDGDNKDADESKNKEEKGENKEEEYEVGFFEVFRFAAKFDIFLMFLGTLGSLAHGTIMPLLIYLLGEAIDDFVNPDAMGFENCTTNSSVPSNQTVNNNSTSLNQTELDTLANIAKEAAKDSIQETSVYFAIVGGACIVVSFFQSYCWNAAGENQIHRIRKLYFRSLLRQDISWYDKQETAAIPTQFIDDMKKIQAGISDKLGLFLHNSGAFIGCLVVGFISVWQVCLVLIALLPVNIAVTFLMFKVGFARYEAEAKAYSNAGCVAQQVIQSIRTVTAFGRQQDEIDRYTVHLDEARAVSSRSGLYSGLLFGTTYAALISMYAIGFSYGIKLIDSGTNYSIGEVLMVVFAVIEGTFEIGQSLSAISEFGSSRASAGRIFKVIDEPSVVNPYSDEGKKCDKKTFTGKIVLKDVTFSYPSRPDVPVLKRLNLEIEPGKTTAFVGPSGCGKSTVLQLIQRLYDVDSGSITIDGISIDEYNISSLRTMLGSVSQEPLLFNTTIEENIQYGTPEEVSKDEITEAANLANAHDFISRLPAGYGTLVGESGSQLSGGQKQRIAIARALVRNPRVLLLDEATSALDTESEAIVQEALEKAQVGRTTIAIAHRLSTIMNADKIIVLSDGEVVEVGVHSDLVAKNGVYAGLVNAQQGGKNEGGDASVSASDRRHALVEKHKHLDDAPGQQEGSDENKRLTAFEEKKIEDEMVSKYYSFTRLWKMAKPETFYYIVGSLAACLCGLVFPMFAVIFSQIFGAFFLCTHDERIDEALKYSLFLLICSAASFVGFTMMFWMFALAGERLVLRARQLAFSAMLQQDIAWFDRDDNSSGVLAARLATQASAVKDATGGQAGQIVQIVAGLIATLVISFYYDWRVTLIMLCFAPIGIISTMAVATMFTDSVVQDKDLEEATRALTSATGNIRTVAALGLQQVFFNEYHEPLRRRHKKQHKNKIAVGIIFGLFEASFLFAYAASFYAASVFIFDWGIGTFDDALTAIIAVMFAAYFIGTANALAPDQTKAKLGVAQIFKMLDETPTINWQGTENKTKPSSFEGTASFKNVHFHYPTRTAVKILKGLDLAVEQGKTVALVGGSGCGKSTLIQLIERFYDPIDGEIFMDDNNLKSLNLNWARGKIALVQQEPNLFDRTIGENIAYGVYDASTKDVSQGAIEEAAKMANIHEFIKNLPDGYGTTVGEKGSQLSGGQKQRIAIARALIRKPKMLLLDEATSALDSESEKVVQEALDKARSGRTVMSIAHRLSTVQTADVIAVIEDGIIKEMGKHAELLDKKGIYYALWSAQSLST